jgi:hypothetical protein
MYGILINQKEQEHPEIDLSGEQCAAGLPWWQRLWHRLSGLMGWQRYCREALIYSASGMKCKEPGAQKTRHIMKIGEFSSTARRGNSPAQPINQRFLSGCGYRPAGC